MISNNPTEPIQPEPPQDTDAAVRAPIEVASSGTGTTGDPGATDKKPPGIAGLELMV